MASIGLLSPLVLWVYDTNRVIFGKWNRLFFGRILGTTGACKDTDNKGRKRGAMKEENGNFGSARGSTRTHSNLASKALGSNP